MQRTSLIVRTTQTTTGTTTTSDSDMTTTPSASNTSITCTGTGNNSSSSLTVSFCCVVVGALASSALTYYYCQSRRSNKSSSSSNENDDNVPSPSGDITDTSILVNSWKQKRDEERTGRIRAEVKLRDALTKIQKYETKYKLVVDGTLNENAGDNEIFNTKDDIMVLQMIGNIISPFPKRMGTPRQGSLVPSVRGCVQLQSKIDPLLLDGIEAYSHIWILFSFHHNTNLNTSTKTKIRPPRAPHKVGQLSTRSPHRPNPLGLSLVKVERWEASKRRLHISALDLVDGTPVYDIKPWIPWDIPNIGHQKNTVGFLSGLPHGNYNNKDDIDNKDANAKSSSKSGHQTPWVVPSWVDSQDDVLPNVTWTTQAKTEITNLSKKNKIHPLLYPSSDPASLPQAISTIEQILAQDPRSSHRGLVKNKRGTVTSLAASSSSSFSTSSSSSPSNSMNEDDVYNTKGNDDAYRLQFGQTIVEFVVETDGACVKNIVEAPSPP